MIYARFGLQALAVLALVVLVSYPDHRQLRAVSVWRAGGPLASGGNVDDVLARYADRRVEIGFGSIGLERTSAAGGSANSLLRRLYENDVEGRRRQFTTPAAVLMLGGKINGIIGRVRTTLNASVPHARLVLRNVVSGQVEARATADEEGRFTFLDVMPSGYVVELVGPDGAVLAASELVSVDLGDLQETSVRVSASQGPPALFGNTFTSTSDEPLATAEEDGVNLVAAPERCVSPPCGTPPG